MQDIYQGYLAAEKDIKSILGAQLMADNPQDYSIMEGLITSILEEWDAKGPGGLAFFVHVMATKCEQFYNNIAEFEGVEPLELFQNESANGFTPEGYDPNG